MLNSVVKYIHIQVFQMNTFRCQTKNMIFRNSGITIYYWNLSFFFSNQVMETIKITSESQFCKLSFNGVISSHKFRVQMLPPQLFCFVLFFFNFMAGTKGQRKPWDATCSILLGKVDASLLTELWGKDLSPWCSLGPALPVGIQSGPREPWTPPPLTCQRGPHHNIAQGFSQLPRGQQWNVDEAHLAFYFNFSLISKRSLRPPVCN